MEPEFNLKPRIGIFFYLVGFGLMLLFVGSEFGREPNFNFFFFGLGALFLGFLLRRRQGPPPESARFKTLRRVHNLTRKQQDDRRKKQTQQQKK